jgi:hypothetical protein
MLVRKRVDVGHRLHLRDRNAAPAGYRWETLGYPEFTTHGGRDSTNREGIDMALGTSLLLIAVGAILKWAVTDTVAGVELATIGVILMVVGVLGLLFSLFFASAWADRRGGVARDRVVERDPYA